MRRSRNKSARRGMFALFALAVVAIVSMLGLMLIQLAVARRDVLRSGAARTQARWLAESGFGRAAWRLASDGTYGGETWNVSAKSLGGRDAAKVRIDVQPVPGRPGRRSVRVVADYPDDPQHRVQITIERTIDAAASNTGT